MLEMKYLRYGRAKASVAYISCDAIKIFYFTDFSKASNNSKKNGLRKYIIPMPIEVRQRINGQYLLLSVVKNKFFRL